MILRLAENKEDFNFLYETRTHSSVSKMLTGDPPQSYESHLNYIKKVQEKNRWIFVAQLINLFVGYSQIYNVTEDNLEVGFVIHPNFQGKGLGKNLVVLTIARAKELFSNRKIYLYVKSDNFKAIHIYESLGFVNKNCKNNVIYMELG